MRVINAVLCVLMVVIFVAVIFMLMLRRHYYVDEDVAVNDFDLDTLTKNVKHAIENSLRERVEDLNLNKYETEKIKHNKTRLRTAVRDAPSGDIGAKEHVKDYIMNLLQTKFGINEFTINSVIAFNEPEKLTPNDKFKVILYVYKKKYKLSAFARLLTDNGLDVLRDGAFEVTETDIKQIYKEQVHRLKYTDKLAILCQAIYEKIYGHSIIDELRDMKVDGISIGVSGVSEEMFNYTEEYIEDLVNSEGVHFSYNAIWVFFRGKSIHLSCIGFRSQKEFVRVCSHIYQYKNPGQLSENKGYITNELKDGARIVVVRPPFSDSWAAIMRKHVNGKVISVNDFLTDKNKEIPLYISKCLVKGCQILALTGAQGSGKTTYLRALIEYLPRTYNLRIQELIFELALRTVFGKRNIVTFKETPEISGQEGLDLQKKTDGDVNILGEVASSLVANWVIQMSQVASLMTMFTHHAKTTRALITWMRDALLKDGGLSNEKAATEEVVNCINFDIHFSIVRYGKNYGHRYIQRITQIIPDEEDKKGYRTKDIVVFDRKFQCYRLCNRISDEALDEMFEYFSDEEIEEFNEFFDKWEEAKEDVA